MQEIFAKVAEMLVFLVKQFWTMLDAMSLKNHYFGYVFVAMATGFLLKRFGSALSLGSDRAANHFKRKGDE